ncbi:DEKNAAC102510 [Brettanomyces naardenensis]|uniref:DEKNAAC102510 n=1 Tax=Brettanomyces naardenensis TaxID=13370 RepID=A0A448YLD2_BRENA|nr:DEKNAAC102510 [Brettanomyces naardenensis]
MDINIKPDKNRDKIRKLSLYKSCEGDYTLNKRYGYSFTNKVEKSAEDIKIDHTKVPKLKEEYAKTGQYLQPVRIAQEGHKVSPDELLSMGWLYNPSELPYLTREEVREKSGQDLPDPELLKSLHYYMLDRVSKSPLVRSSSKNPDDYHRFLDEGALLALGKTVESWIEQLATEEDEWIEYMERVREKEEVDSENEDSSSSSDSNNDTGNGSADLDS